MGWYHYDLKAMSVFLIFYNQSAIGLFSEEIVFGQTWKIPSVKCKILETFCQINMSQSSKMWLETDSEYQV